jgi:hypothetical protein
MQGMMQTFDANTGQFRLPEDIADTLTMLLGMGDKLAQHEQRMIKSLRSTRHLTKRQVKQVREIAQRVSLRASVADRE